MLMCQNAPAGLRSVSSHSAVSQRRFPESAVPVQLLSFQKDPSIKDLNPVKNHISIRLKDKSFVLPVSNLLRGQMKVDLLEAQPQSSSGHLATKRDHGPLSGREPWLSRKTSGKRGQASSRQGRWQTGPGLAHTNTQTDVRSAHPSVGAYRFQKGDDIDFQGSGWECQLVWLMLISVCGASPVRSAGQQEPAGAQQNPAGRIPSRLEGREGIRPI